MIEQIVVEALNNDQNLTDKNTIIRPLKLEIDDNGAALTYQFDKTFDHTYDGASGLNFATLEINVYAPTLLECKQLALDVNYALTDLVGVNNQTTIYRVQYIREIDGIDIDPETYRTNQQFSIQYKEG